MKKSLLFIALAFSCATCVKPEQPVIETWNIEKLEAGSSDTLSQKLYQDAFLSFYKDGKLSFYQKFAGERRRPLYFTGTWKEYGSGLELSIDSLNLHEKFEIQEISSRWLVLVVTGNPLLNGTTFTGKSFKHYKSDTYDLLDPANNTWRQKPAHKESPLEIEARVLNHLQYLIAYFQLVEDKEQTYFETGILQTPIRFHDNGLSLIGRVEKNPKWRSCFYDYEDAYAGGKVLAASMKSIGKYPEDESLAKGYHDALTIMAEYLQE